MKILLTPSMACSLSGTLVELGLDNLSDVVGLILDAYKNHWHLCFLPYYDSSDAYETPSRYEGFFVTISHRHHLLVKVIREAFLVEGRDYSEDQIVNKCLLEYLNQLPFACSYTLNDEDEDD